MQDLTLALIQAPLHWEDREANLDMFEEKIKAIKGVDIIILPEMFSTGFSMNPEPIADEMEGDTLKWLTLMAYESEAVVTGSVIIKNDDRYYNRLIWMQSDGQFMTYDKRHLFSMAGEEKLYTPGDKKLTVTKKGWRICPMICYDLRFPVWSRNIENYDLLVFVANWPQKRANHWRTLLQARAIENQCYVAGVNRIGKDANDFTYAGNSMIVDSLGEILQESVNKEEILIQTISAEELMKNRRYMPFLKDKDTFEITGLS